MGLLLDRSKEICRSDSNSFKCLKRFQFLLFFVQFLVNLQFLDGTYKNNVIVEDTNEVCSLVGETLNVICFLFHLFEAVLQITPINSSENLSFGNFSRDGRNPAACLVIHPCVAILVGMTSSLVIV